MSVVRRVGAVGLTEDLAAVRIRMGLVVGRMVTAGKKILLRLWGYTFKWANIIEFI